jgi:chromosome partitioning protein
MKTISIINLKGGVSKTTTAINMAHILATEHNYKVLLVDNDKQGNTTKFFDKHNEKINLADILTDRIEDIKPIIVKTKFDNLDIIPANMKLLSANLKLIIDTNPREHILKTALKSVNEKYDYCIIDNAPDINISVLNALIASDEVIIPMKIDKFTFDGLDELEKQIKQAKQINSALALKGCLITQFAKNEVNSQGEDYLQNSKYHVFRTHIRRTEKVDESTFSNKPILEHSRRCGASKDYVNFVKEYLETCP